MRLLRKYFYNQLRKFFTQLTENSTQPSSDELIFELNNLESNDSNEKLIRIKKNIKFHLFISSAPCGDGRIFSINDNAIKQTNDQYYFYYFISYF